MASNKLIHETSPYLLQHAHNPVDWYPWGQEAFDKAKNENKLLLVSIGYSACHWCHVMERESFEDVIVADQMNKHFVCIKVDREERPDVDQIYMEAVQLLNGNGGWPLNCFALPDGQPIWGGTYFPQNQWIEVLDKISSMYLNQTQLIIDQAQQLTDGVRQQDFPELSTFPQRVDEETLISHLTQHFDNKHGGFGRSPKFPMPVALNLILQLGYQRKNKTLLDFIYLTLNKIASGGIYDQVGGGFARYSVDEYWFAPHFEKMLYDNAQLISLYSNAYKSSKNATYQRVVEETISFIERELTSPEGLFYSALDADSEGVEGKFYTWTTAELKNTIADNSHFYKYFNIEENGNWEDGVNILHAQQLREDYAQYINLDPSEFNGKLQSSLNKLLNIREKRVRPGMDDKILTSWNGLMIDALCTAYQAIGNPKYIEMAKQAMHCLLHAVNHSDNQLYRSFKEGVSKINGFLDDYAFVIQALINLYQSTFDESYMNKALLLTQYVMDKFYDKVNGIIYYTSSEGEKLIARKTDLQDNVIPASVSTMAYNLLRLSQFKQLPEYENIAELLIEKMYHQIEQHPTYYAQWALLSVFRSEKEEIAIVGPQAEKFRSELQKTLRVATIYAGSINGNSELDLLKNRSSHNKTLIYKCKNKSCQLPIEDINLI